MAKYIDKAALVGERLTSSAQQLRFREMTGAEAYNEFLRLVNEMPTADVAPVRHGKWLKAIDNDCEMHRCDQCGARVVKELYEYENPNRYCYHCGARMDLGGTNDA